VTQMKLVLFLSLFVFVSSLPTQTNNAEEIMSSDQINLQLKKITFWPHHYYNYTCNECNKMVSVTQDFCRMNSHQLRGKEVDFSPFCAGFVHAVSDDAPKLLEEKCSLYHLFVQELYCPNDPCTQITNVAYNAPNSICGLLRCSNKKLNLTSEETFPAEPLPNPPLTCLDYVDAISHNCSEQKRIDPSKNTDFSCDVYQPNFVREGCQLVKAKLVESFGTREICANLDCEQAKISNADLCTNVMGFIANHTLSLPEYNTWKLTSVGKPAPLPPSNPYGINILESTYGTKCASNLNNYLNSSKAQCEKLTKCMLTHPKFSSHPELFNAECTEEFQIRFKCAKLGPLHKVYSAENPLMESISIDCTPEIPNSSPMVLDLFDHFKINKDGEIDLKTKVFDLRENKK